MARKCGPNTLQERVAVHFEKVLDDELDFMYKCKIGDCVKIISGKKQHNLVSHAKTHYTFFHVNFQPEEAQLLTMPARRLEFIQDCTEMVTVDGQPFAALNGSGFKKLIAEKLQSLTTAGFGIGLKAPQCEAVKEQIPYLAMQIRNQIKLEVKKKFVSLMIDTASKFQRSILGVSLQYMLESTIVVRTIGMINMTTSHTAEHIATEVLNCLNVFDIKTTQLISVTTDNASNMTAMIQRFNEMFGQDAATNENTVSDIDECDEEIEFSTGNRELEADFQFNFTNEDVEAGINIALEEMESAEPESNEDLLSIIDDRSNYENLLNDLEIMLAEHTLNIVGIRCAAHTLQLAVQNTLKIPEFQILIRLCKAVCKELRKTSKQYALDKENIKFKTPRLDCKTRWNSTYIMVSTDVSNSLKQFKGG